MIKALAHDESGKPIVFLGITDGNVEKLTQGLPIHIDLMDLGGELEVRMLIFMLKDGTSVGTIKRDKPLSLRDDLIAAVDEFLNAVGDIDGLEDLVDRLQEAVDNMRP